MPTLSSDVAGPAEDAVFGNSIQGRGVVGVSKTRPVSRETAAAVQAFTAPPRLAEAWSV